jgi:hypothetical protein
MQAANVEAEGVLFVEVTDPKSGKSFRFYDFEHAVALALDGRPLDAVATDLRANAQLELSSEQLAAFADQLEALGFLESVQNGEPVAESADNFFPPLTAEETGSFERPPILGEGGATAEILGQLTPAPEPEPMVSPPAAVTPPPQPIAPASPPVASANPPTPAPIPALRSRPPEPKTPEPDQIVSAGEAELPTPVPVPLPAPMAPPGPAPGQPMALAPSAPAFRSSNGAHASGELESSLPADSPRSWRPLSERPSQAAPALDTPPPISAAVSAESRREALRLVPSPFAGAAAHEAPPPPLPGNPAHFDLPPLGTAPTEPNPTAEPLFSDEAEEHLEEHGGGHGQALAAETLEPPLFNTGSPNFPPPVPEDPNAPVQRLELSMTRRFITPDRAKPIGAARKIWLAYAGLGLAAAAVVFVMVYKYFATSEPPPVSVRVVVPSPTSVYRWWDATASVQQTGGAPMTMPRDGKVAEVVPEGTRFAAGDVLVMLESAKPFRSAINHNKSRLAYYEQMRDTMTQQDNRAKLRDAELKIAEKKRLITEAQEAFNNHALVATQPGEVAEALVTRGGAIKAGEPVLRLKSSGYRALFELPKADADKARQLGFCRIEIEGKPLDCSLAAEGGDETHVAIELPNDPNLTGKTVRLARDRLDAVFSVPASALVKVGESDRLYVVGANGRAEMRVVAVADRGPGGATVTQGLDVGDRVIVDVPSGLKAESRVLISSTSAR